MDAVDVKTLEALGGKVSRITVSSGRKLTDGNWGSIEGSFVFEIEASPDADPAALATAGYEYAKALANQTVVADGLALQAQNAKAAPQKAPQHAPGVGAMPVSAGSAPKSAPRPSAAPKAAQGELSYVTVENPTCAHIVLEGGQDAFRVFGKGPGLNADRWGIKCYKEPLESCGIGYIWTDWPVCKSTKEGFPQENRFQLPDGYTAVSVQVEAVKREDGSEQLKPLRVVEFLKAAEE